MLIHKRPKAIMQTVPQSFSNERRKHVKFTTESVHRMDSETFYSQLVLPLLFALYRIHSAHSHSQGVECFGLVRRHQCHRNGPNKPKQRNVTPTTTSSVTHRGLLNGEIFFVSFWFMTVNSTHSFGKLLKWKKQKVCARVCDAFVQNNHLEIMLIWNDQTKSNPFFFF